MKPVDVPPGDPEKKIYSAPKLRELGTVHMTTQGSTGTVGDGQADMNMQQSDVRVKERVQRVGSHPMGFGLYTFDYKPAFQRENGAGRQFGVIADEVEKFVPDAVTVGTDGYKRVDYARLGISSPSHTA